MRIDKKTFKKIINVITDSDRIVSVVTDIKGYLKDI